MRPDPDPVSAQNLTSEQRLRRNIDKLCQTPTLAQLPGDHAPLPADVEAAIRYYSWGLPLDDCIKIANNESTDRNFRARGKEKPGLSLGVLEDFEHYEKKLTPEQFESAKKYWAATRFHVTCHLSHDMSPEEFLIERAHRGNAWSDHFKELGLKDPSEILFPGSSFENMMVGGPIKNEH